ncbi:MAG: GIY-YIG nuclease family protein [Clostridiales bacterium]|nr:GIY-YIG nuclease family protein [Clostridiales bacterium]
MKKHWYLETWVIAICFFFGVLGIPAIIGIFIIIFRAIQDRKNLKAFNALQEQNKELLENNENLKAENNQLIQEKQNTLNYIQKIGLDTYEKVKTETERLQNQIGEYNLNILRLKETILELEKDIDKKELQVNTQARKVSQMKDLYKALEYSIQHSTLFQTRIFDGALQEVEAIYPSVQLRLHYMDVKELKKAFKENEKNINKLLKEYSAQYTTKANIAIYNLMVIALKSELQNILYNLKYEKLDIAINQIKEITTKYLRIAGEGNQVIINTLVRFIGQIEYLFINAVKIEYNYYVKKEQAKQEQMALREQMRQETEERKALEAERKKIEREEAKYHAEIDKLNEQMTAASDTEIEQLKTRILELQNQLSDIIVKKEEIATLANGKAGNVYIISNLGAFGDNVFKIGMTRRLDPQERVNELGSASVPFKFDVHSFIFSNDAVSLENKLHTMLNDKRVNKVNTRKEFFRVTIDELEELVAKIEPTAEFNRSMIADEYYQTQSLELQQVSC